MSNISSQQFQQNEHSERSIDWRSHPLINTGTPIHQGPFIPGSHKSPFVSTKPKVKAAQAQLRRPQKISSGPSIDNHGISTRRARNLMQYNVRMHRILGLPQHVWINYYRANRGTRYPILSFTSFYDKGHHHYAKGIKYSFTNTDIRACKKDGPKYILARKAYKYVHLGGSCDLRDKFDVNNIQNYMQVKLAKQKKRQDRLLTVRRKKYALARELATEQGEHILHEQRKARQKSDQKALRNIPTNMRTIFKNLKEDAQRQYHNNFYRSQLHRKPSHRKISMSFNGAYIMLMKRLDYTLPGKDKYSYSVSIKPVVHTEQGDKYLVNKRLPNGKLNHFLTMPYHKFHLLLGNSGNSRYMLKHSRARREGITINRQRLFYSTPVRNQKTGRYYLRPSIPLSDRISFKAPITNDNHIDVMHAEPLKPKQAQDARVANKDYQAFKYANDQDNLEF